MDGSVAEFEHDLIRERTQSGLAAARAGGCKSNLDNQQVQEFKALLRDPDIQVAEVARRYGVPEPFFNSMSASSRRVNEDLGCSYN